MIAGPVYIEDVFAQPSVKAKTLKVGHHAPQPRPIVSRCRREVGNAVEPVGGGAAEKTFAPVTATVVPRKWREVVVKVTGGVGESAGCGGRMTPNSTSLRRAPDRRGR